MNPAVILIPTLILVSGLVAFVGNQVGRSIGRRRLAVLGLRPRYTAQLVTVLTGMLITVVLLLSRGAAAADDRGSSAAPLLFTARCRYGCACDWETPRSAVSLAEAL